MLQRKDLLLFNTKDSYEFSVNTESISKNLLGIQFFYKLKSVISLTRLIKYRLYVWFIFKDLFFTLNSELNGFSVQFSLCFYFFEFFYFLKMIRIFSYYRESSEFMYIYNKGNISFDNSLKFLYFSFLLDNLQFYYSGSYKLKALNLKSNYTIKVNSIRSFAYYYKIFLGIHKQRFKFLKFKLKRGKKKLRKFYKREIFKYINTSGFGYIQSRLFLGMTKRFRKNPNRSFISWLLFFKFFNAYVFRSDNRDVNCMYLVNIPQNVSVPNKVLGVAYYNDNLKARNLKKIKVNTLKRLYFLSRLAIVTMKVVYSNVFFISEGFKVDYRTNEVTRKVLGNYTMKHGTDRWDIDDLYFGFKSKRVRRQNYWYILRKMFVKLGMSLVYSKSRYIIARFITGFRRNYLINQLQKSIRFWNKKRRDLEKRPVRFRLLMVLFVPKIPFNKGLRKQKAKRKKFRFRKRKNFVLRIRRGFRR